MTHRPTTYTEALDWLFVQTRSEAPRDPARMRALFRDLNLQPPPNAVHVVGTNGKGTVSHLVAGGLNRSGQRTGLFISPHVEEFRERISVDGQRISEEEVLEFAQRAYLLEKPYAFFELCFALASEHFRRVGVEMSVIEAGVGAKNDATITLQEVHAVVITNVSLDHQDTLGSTQKAIAFDKAEAIRPRVPTFTAAQGEALEVIKKVAAERHSHLHIHSAADPLFSIPSSNNLYYPENARLAAAALRTLGVSEKTIEATMTSSPLPARREVFTVKGKTIILDGGHNPAAAQALSASLKEPYVLIFGALPKKQGEATLGVLEPGAHTVILTKAAGQIDPELIKPERSFIPDPIEALERALELCSENASILITGSLYLAGELRPYLKGKT